MRAPTSRRRHRDGVQLLCAGRLVDALLLVLGCYVDCVRVAAVQMATTRDLCVAMHEEGAPARRRESEIRKRPIRPKLPIQDGKIFLHYIYA